MHRRLIRRYSTPSVSRPAVVLRSAVSGSSPAPPAPSSQPGPQPFIPRPLSKTPQVTSLARSTSPHATIIKFSRGPSVVIPNLWLRDSSVHEDHVHPASQQKLFRTSDVPLDGEIKGYGVHHVPGKGECIVTEWTTPVAGVRGGSANLSVVPVSLLLARDVGPPPLPKTVTWDRLSYTPSRVPYSQYSTSSSALRETLSSLLSHGLAFLSSVPTTPKSGQDTELRRVVERIGSIRRTWYGDLWDVKAEVGSKNIAYTNLDLGLHMDLTHFESPPRYQFLHSLLNARVSGGESYFVDSYHIASLIRESSPELFRALCEIPVTFEYHNGGQHTFFRRPTIELCPSSSSSSSSSSSQTSSPSITAVNYSPPFQGPFSLSIPTSELELLHEALSEFARLANEDENQFRVQLQPGDCVLFDNRRVLHARTAFEFLNLETTAPEKSVNGGEEEDSRGRWLKGAYMDGDEVRSKWRVLQDEKEEDQK